MAVEDGNASDLERKMKLEEDMRKFKEEMAQKREARKEAIQNLNQRILELQEERDKERHEKIKLEEELRKLRNGNELNELNRKEDVAQCTSETEPATVESHEQRNLTKSDAAQVEDENSEGTSTRNGDEDAMSEHDKDEVIEGLERQVKALKDVAVIGGEMLKIRELQVRACGVQHAQFNKQFSMLFMSVFCEINPMAESVCFVF